MRILASKRYDLIMVNSFWNQRYALVPVALAAIGTLKGPVLLLPRGELEPGAIAMKPIKKRLAGPVFRAVYRQGVTVVGATSVAESSNARSWFPKAPVVVTTNNLPDPIPWGQPRAPSPRLRALFLSRINPKKGLLQLLHGLRLVTRAVDMSIVGPVDDRTYWLRCERAIAELPDHVVVTYVGLAARDQIAPLLWNSDCMVLLTAGENYGHVIAESLQAGCPVITTPTTPWTDVIRRGGGEIIEDRDDPDQVAEVLDRWAAKNSEGLSSSRVHARAAFEQFQSTSSPNIINLALDALGGK